jgi:hypothetical protein
LGFETKLETLKSFLCFLWVATLTLSGVERLPARSIHKPPRSTLYGQPTGRRFVHYIIYIPNGESLGRIAMGGHELPKVLRGPAMPYMSMPCGQVACSCLLLPWTPSAICLCKFLMERATRKVPNFAEVSTETQNWLISDLIQIIKR